MFACTRSLMKRASRSSSYSAPQSVLSSDARPALLPGSSLAAGERARRRRRRCAGRARGSPRSARAWRAARRARSSARRDRPRRASPAGAARGAPAPGACTSRSPCRRASRRTSALRLRQPALDRGHDAALGDAVAVADLRVVGQVGADGGRAAPAPREEQLRAASPGSAAPRSNSCRSAGRRRRRRRAGWRPPAGRRARSASCRCRARARRSVTTSSVLARGSFSPITDSSTPITFSLVARVEPCVRGRRRRARSAGRPAPAPAPRAAPPGRRRVPRCWAHSPTA